MKTSVSSPTTSTPRLRTSPTFCVLLVGTPLIRLVCWIRAFEVSSSKRVRRARELLVWRSTDHSKLSADSGSRFGFGTALVSAVRHDLVEFRHGRIAHRAPEVELRAPLRIDLPGDRGLRREVGRADRRLADGSVARDVVAIEGGPGLATGAERDRPVRRDLPLVLHPEAPGLGLAGAQGAEEAGAVVRRGEPARQRVGRVVERVLVAVDAEAHLVRAADAAGAPDALGVRGPPVGAAQLRIGAVVREVQAGADARRARAGWRSGRRSRCRPPRSPSSRAYRSSARPRWQGAVPGAGSCPTRSRSSRRRSACRSASGSSAPSSRRCSASSRACG